MDLIVSKIDNTIVFSCGEKKLHTIDFGKDGYDKLVAKEKVHEWLNNNKCYDSVQLSPRVQDFLSRIS